MSTEIPEGYIRDVKEHVLNCKRTFGEDNYTMYVTYTAQWSTADGVRIMPWAYEEFMSCKPEA